MKGYTLNLTAKTLTITKAFEEAIATGTGDAYELYTQFLRDIPGLTVVRKTHKTPSKYTSKSTGETFKCNQFKNLKYENMEGFIKGLPNNEEYLKAYNFLKNFGALPQTSCYKVVREWFVAQFPEFRKNPLFYLYNEVKVIDIAPYIEAEQTRVAEKEENDRKEKKVG